MRRAFTWIAGLVGIAAVARWLRRRGAPAQTTEPAADPADELRQRLAETRETERNEEAPAPDVASLDERRAQIHEQARAAIDEMSEPPAGA